MLKAAPDRPRVSTTVARHIQELILSGQLKIGDRLPSEPLLCQQLGVGRSSLREALRALEALGYVDVKPGRGRFLRDDRGPTVETRITAWLSHPQRSVGDLVELGAALESMAAGLAAGRGTPAEIEAISKAEAAFEEHVVQGDLTESIRADEAFHEALLRASHSDLLAMVHELIRQPLHEYRCTTFVLPGHPRRSVEPHRAILAAVRRHDARAAREATVVHVFSAAAEAAETAMTFHDKLIDAIDVRC